jgi:hypothetical protein
MKYSMTNYVTFQKWTQNEMMILLANGIEDEEGDGGDDGDGGDEGDGDVEGTG